MTDKPPERPSRMPKLSRNSLTVAAATAAAAVSGTAIAGAAGNASPAATGSQRPADARGAGETPLSGATKDKVQAAALARVDGTVLRVETDAGGVYEAHIRKADGTEVEVKVDKSFAVTAVNAMDAGHGGPGGHGPGGHGDLAAVAQKLGVTEAKLRSALDAARPAGDHKDRGDWAAGVAKALGVETAKVQQILDANRPQPGAGRGRDRGPGRLDDSALVGALAKGLSQTEAQVRSALTQVAQAHQAERTARESAMYAAVAKALGKDAAAVKAAFEAARPTP
jgi:uncharacterized membrane protein YkoI